MAVPTIVQKAQGQAGTAGVSISATFGATPTAGNLLVGFCNMVAVGTPASWPAGWTEVATKPESHPAGSHCEGMSIATRVAGAGEPTLVTVGGPNFDRRSLQLVEVAGGTYDQVVPIGVNGPTWVDIPPLTPPAGHAILLLAQVHWCEAVGRGVDPVGYALEQEQAPNTGGNSVRATNWSRAIPAAAGAYTGRSNTSGAGIFGTGGQVSIDGGGSAAFGTRDHGEPGGGVW